MTLPLPRHIIDRPIYSVGLGLPFICAFYLRNAVLIVDAPFGIEITGEWAALIYIAEISIIYFMSMFTIHTLRHLSIISENKMLVAIGALFFGSSIAISSFANTDKPMVFILFFFISLLNTILTWIAPDNDEISHASSIIIVAPFSLFCIVTGIMWIDGSDIFINIVKRAIGLVDINSSTMKLGAISLITTGYSVLYVTSGVAENSKD